MAFSAPTTHQVLSKRSDPLTTARKTLSVGRRPKHDPFDITVPSVAANRKLSEKIRKLRDELKIERDHRKLLEERVYPWKTSNPTETEPLTTFSGTKTNKGRVADCVSRAPRNTRQYLHTRELEEKLIERSTQLQETERKLKRTVAELLCTRRELVESKAKSRENEVKLETFYKLSQSLLQVFNQASISRASDTYRTRIEPQLSALGIKSGNSQPKSAVNGDVVKRQSQEALDLFLSNDHDSLMQGLQNSLHKKLDTISAMLPDWCPGSQNTDATTEDGLQNKDDAVEDTIAGDPADLWKTLRDNLNNGVDNHRGVPLTALHEVGHSAQLEGESMRQATQDQENSTLATEQNPSEQHDNKEREYQRTSAIASTAGDESRRSSWQSEYKDELDVPESTNEGGKTKKDGPVNNITSQQVEPRPLHQLIHNP